MNTFTTEKLGVPLIVEYAIERGYPATHYDPGMPDCLCDLRVLLAGHDIMGLLRDTALDAIEQECYDREIQSLEDDLFP